MNWADYKHEREVMTALAEMHGQLAEIKAAIAEVASASTLSSRTILKELRIMATDLTRIETEVAETATVIDSAIVLLNGLAQMLRDAATDPARINALADSLDAQQSALSAAIVANTPPAQ